MSSLKQRKIGIIFNEINNSSYKHRKKKLRKWKKLWYVGNHYKIKTIFEHLTKFCINILNATNFSRDMRE